MPISATTLLRTIRSVPLPAVDRPHVVGVDDWALRKGRTYGTIVVDLERRRPIDRFPDGLTGQVGSRVTFSDKWRVYFRAW